MSEFSSEINVGVGASDVSDIFTLLFLLNTYTKINPAIINILKKLFDILAPKYKETNGGYIRVLKMGARKSDGAQMAVIEFV